MQRTAAMPDVLVRITPGVEAHTHEFVRTGQVDSKFGFGVESGAAAAAALERASMSPAMRLAGVHVHIGSQVFVADFFHQAIDVIAPFVTGHDLEEFSVGGGLGVAYVEGETAPTITAWAASVRDACAAAGIRGRITAEPGRAIVAAAAVTVYTVGTVKDLPGIRTYVAVDGGMSDNPRPVLYGSGYETFLPRAVAADRPRAVTVVGKHCESGDLLVRDGWVPADLAVGDLLATPVTGAYGHSMGSNYNKVPRPAVVFAAGGDARLVVRRETHDDLPPPRPLTRWGRGTPRVIGRATRAQPQTVRVGVLGCGNVGAALVQLIQGQGDAIAARTGVRLEVARVAVRSAARERPVVLPDGVITTDAAEVATDPGIDVVVEVIGGIEPARELILAALAAGKPVVTANKELLANVGAELFAAAEAAGVDLLFEAAVAGGIPLIRPLRESLVGRAHPPGDGHRQRHDELHPHPHDRGGRRPTRRPWPRRRASATPSGTRRPTSRATTPAPRPRSSPRSRSVPGSWPATCTTRASRASRRPTSPSPAASGTSSSCWRSPTSTTAPSACGSIPRWSPPTIRWRACARATTPCSSKARPSATSCSTGAGPGGAPTASAVLGDLIDAAGNLRKGVGASLGSLAKAVIRPIDDVESEYYLRIDVFDRPGVLAQVATVFATHGVSIRAMEQDGLGDEARLIFITHIARERDLQATVRGLRELEAVDQVGTLLRVVGTQ